VAGALVGCALAPVLASAYGPVGLAVAFLVGTAVIAGGPVLVTWRNHGMAWTGVFGRALALLVLAGTVGAWLDPVESGLALRLAAAASFLLLCAAVLYRDVRGLLDAARSRV
jgi:hypothetical protein